MEGDRENEENDQLSPLQSDGRERSDSTAEHSVLFTERYNNGRENMYVKSPGQSNVTMVKSKENTDVIGGFLGKIFLPRGYPQSVSNDYKSYQIWDTAQAFCSTFTGVAATQEVLKGLGVGDMHATSYAATVTWILKSVSGQLGGIAFAYSYGSYLDAYSKKWRLIADIFNDVALCLELALPLYMSFTPLVLCITNAMKAVVGIAGGATKSAMIHHHAVRGNAADVSAKDSAQETAVNLISSVIAVILLPILPFPTFIFLSMIFFHILSNYMAVRSLCLKTFNETRYLQVISMFLRDQLILSPAVVNAEEPLNLWEPGTPKLDLETCGFKIQIGKSMNGIGQNNMAKARHWMVIKRVYNDKKYILFPDRQKKTMYLYVKDDISVDELLCGYYHAVTLSIVICALNDQNLPILNKTKNRKAFLDICQLLRNTEWSKSLEMNEPSYNVLRYVCDMVERDWQVLYAGLKDKGWNLNKHLLIVDEWRICNTPASDEPATSREESF